MENIKNINNNLENEVIEAENTQAKIKSLKSKLFEQSDAIENAIAKLEKASIILDRWTQEYSFNQKPDPSSIYNNSDPIHKKQTQKWCWEYNCIYEFIDIAFDYIIDSREALEQAIRNKLEQLEQ